MKINKISILRIIALILFFNIFVVSANSYAEDETEEDARDMSGYTTIIATDFESQKFEGWSSLGNRSVISLTDKKAHSGNYSVVTSERDAAWSGPCINLTDLVEPGSAIMIRGFALSASEEKINVMMSLKYTYVDGTESYETIDIKETGSENWTLLENFVIIPSNSANICLYFETEDSLEDFYVDDIEIFGNPKTTETYDENGGLNLNFDFENDMNGWIPRGDIKLNLSQDHGYPPSKQSLYVTDKTVFWNAPMIRLNGVVPGVNYTYSAQIMYMKRNESTHLFSIKLQYNLDGEEIYATINSNEVPDGAWATISGDYIIPFGATDVYFYIQSDDDGRTSDFVSYYVDNVKIFDSSASFKKKKITIIIISAVSGIVLVGLIVLIIRIIRKSRATKEAIRASCIDSMTGAYNRNTFEERVQELEKNPEKCRDIYVTVCDVNFLKYINDNYGHDSGDKAIIRCATILLKAIGKRGTVYRIGGDEFMCITEADFTEAIKMEFARENIDYKGYPFSVAVGTAHYDQQTDNGEPEIKNLIAKSDKEMYKHKIEVKKDFDFS